MKAVFVYRYLTPGGGCEAVLKTRLEGLPALGIEPHAWFLHDLGGRALFTDVADRAHVGPVEELRDFLRRFSPDVLTTLDTGEVLPLSTETPGALLVEAHSTYWESLDYLDRLAEYPVRRILTPSPAHADALRARGKLACPISIVPNPVRSEFLPEPADDGVRPPRPCVGWVGRLDDLKNWRAALDGMRTLTAGGCDAELWLAGKAVEAAVEEELRRAADELGLLPRLRWFRGLPYAAMPAFFDLIRASGGAVLSTSRAESFGLAVAEGMARGCAVVVPDLAAFRDLVTDGVDGLLYPGGDVAAASGILTRVLSNADFRERLGSAARASILARLAPEVVLPVLAEVISASSSA